MKFSRIRTILILLSALFVVREMWAHSVRTLAIEIQEERNGEVKNEFAPIQQQLKTKLHGKPSASQTKSKPHQTRYKLPFIPAVNIPISKVVLHCTFLI